MDDDGHAISYKLLGRGVPILATDGAPLGAVNRVLENEREHIFDGIVMDTDRGQIFVDAPEVARIAERAVTLTIGAAEAASLPPYEPGAPQFKADVRAGRLKRFLGGGGWKRH